MNKKTILKILSLATITTMLFVAGCSKTVEKKQDELSKIKEKGKITVGTSADYPPYEFHKEINGKDEIVGFDIAIAKEIAKDMGVQLEIKDMKFDGLLAALKSGNIDFVVAGMTPKPERRKNADFTKIYYQAVQGVMTRAEDKDKIKTVDDLKGKVIGVQKGTIQADIAKEQIKGAAEIKELGRVPDLVLELQNKKIDAIVVELPVAQAYVNNNSTLGLPTLTFKDSEGGAAIALRKGSPELAAQMNKTIDRLLNEKAIDKFVVEANEMVESK